MGNSLIVHDLASEDKLQATFSHELVDLGMVVKGCLSPL